ncbi:MAG: hypothetical protein KC413_05450 [Anaerolineales bacterium]|nr:hypothetical protein [Anaerolineales bacterium]MCA9975171.1 hypothetical protein [Anaerolineales bacterium]MCB8965576.1 hypothetical protein [Ardenticatenaceae bacterium]
MSSYDLKQLVTMWQREKLTPEQAIGQVLLHLEVLAARLGELEKRVETHRRAPDKPE